MTSPLPAYRVLTHEQQLRFRRFKHMTAEDMSAFGELVSKLGHDMGVPPIALLEGQMEDYPECVTHQLVQRTHEEWQNLKKQAKAHFYNDPDMAELAIGQMVRETVGLGNHALKSRYQDPIHSELGHSAPRRASKRCAAKV